MDLGFWSGLLRKTLQQLASIIIVTQGIKRTTPNLKHIQINCSFVLFCFVAYFTSTWEPPNDLHANIFIWLPWVLIFSIFPGIFRNSFPTKRPVLSYIKGKKPNQNTKQRRLPTYWTMVHQRFAELLTEEKRISNKCKFLSGIFFEMLYSLKKKERLKMSCEWLHAEAFGDFSKPEIHTTFFYPAKCCIWVLKGFFIKEESLKNVVTNYH